MFEFLKELAKNARDYEIGTWAGLVNVCGLLVVSSRMPSVGLAEKAMDRFSILLEGSRSFRAGKLGKRYTPVFKPERPKPEKWARSKNLATVGAYLVLSVVVIAVIDRL